MGSVGACYRVQQLSEAQIFSLSHAQDKLSDRLVFQKIYCRNLMSNVINYQKANSSMNACEACHKTKWGFIENYLEF